MGKIHPFKRWFFLIRDNVIPRCRGNGEMFLEVRDASVAVDKHVVLNGGQRLEQLWQDGDGITIGAVVVVAVACDEDSWFDL